jgi:hypothetical protein|tara:strand:+ start:351 stop:974 length:624 start_codon:yes stop_codon:yes gene_type:complete
MSKLETNTIDTVSGTSTLQVGSTNTTTITLGASGDTINIPSGATIANSGTATGFGENMTPAFFVTRGSDQTISDVSATKIQLDTEILDTDNAFDNSSNYRFTPQTAGKYFIFSGLMANSQANSNLNFFEFYLTKNGTVISQTSNNLASNQPRELQGTLSCIVDMNGSSDYIDMFAYIDSVNNGSILIKGHSEPRARTFMGGYKIIGA